MASADISQYHKYIDLQNVSGSGDPDSAPNGGIYLFASGAVGSAKLYLQNEGVATPLSLADAGTLTVAADSGDNQIVNLASETLTFTGGTGVDTAVASDTVTFSLDLNELSAADVAVDADSIAIIDAGDNSSKKESIADLMTAVAGDGLAASSGVLAVQVGTNKGLALTSDKLEITGSAVAAADIAVAADSFMFFDSDGSVKEESFADYAAAIAGDGLAASSGVLAVGVDDATIELNSDALRVKDGGIDADALASSVAGNGLAGGAGTALSLDLNELSAADVAVGADSIAIVDATDNSSKKESIADLATAMAGDGLAASGGVFAVQVGSNKGLALTSDKLEITGSAVAAEAVAVGEDSFMFFDADGSVKEESFADYAAAIAGAGLAASSGVLAIANASNGGMTVNANDIALNLNDLAAASVDVANDSIAIIDANDSNGSKKESVADLVTAMAGSGLAASAGVLSLDMDELSDAAVASGDKFVFVDATDDSTKKESIDDIATFMAGDGLAASSGVLAVQVGSNKGLALTSDALEITGSAVAAADIAVGEDSFMFFDADGSVKEESFADYAAAIAGTGISAASGVLNVDGVLEDLNTLGAASADGEFIVATGAGAFAYESGNTARTSLGLGTGDSPQFTGVTVGTLSATGDVDLGDATSDTITATGRFDSDLVPSTDSARALGTSALQWSAIHVDVGHIDQLGSALDANNQAITNINVDGGAIDNVTIGTNTAVSQLTSSFVQVNRGLFPDIAGGATIGNASLGFGDIYIADDKSLYFGNGQDVRMEYNEDGDDEFEITIPANGMRLQGTTPTLIIGDGGGEDTKIVFDGQALDFHVGLDDSADKLSLGLGSTPGSTANMLLDGATRDVEFLGNISVPQTKIISLDTDGDSSLRASADDTIQLRVGGSDMVTVISSGVGVNGGYGSGNGISLGADGTGNFDGNLNVGADGAGASFVIYGAAANERMMYDKDNHVLNFRDSSGSTMLNLGGDASSEYALDVANGSDNINKVRAAAFVTYSDESLKQDVSSMNTALDTVMSLNGVEFTWKDSGERDFGFIAQDVQSVLPKAVHVAEDGVQGVDYSRLTSVLVEAVKAQQVQIEELKALLKK